MNRHISGDKKSIAAAECMAVYRFQTCPTLQASKQQAIVIRGGTCVNDDHVFKADILIQAGKIKYDIL